MININDEMQSMLQLFGRRLKEARLERNESQEIFAQRLGLTRQSYSKMEKGSPSVPIGYWLVAGNILNRLSTWKDVFAEQENLFARFDKKAKVRRRAGGRRKKER